MRRRNYSKVSMYVGREYLLSFLIAFCFFFFIFFVNQILVIAQKIVVKNVEISKVLTLVVLSIPQFLMYTMPFSSLASASMVIGNFASQNEILAMRSNGINTFRIFKPIVIISLVFSVLTILIADKMIPFTATKYKDLYSEVLESLPTLELDSYSSAQFGKVIIKTGEVEGNIISDIVIIDNENPRESKIISSEKAQIKLLNLDNLLYRIDLTNPQVLINNVYSFDTYSTADSSEMTIYISFKEDGTTSFVNLTPSQMSISQLKEAIEVKRVEMSDDNENTVYQIDSFADSLGKKLTELDSSEEISLNSLEEILYNASDLNYLLQEKDFNFYYQYYRSELYKKIALSLACTCLVFVAFPISFFKVKYGKLLGFGLSMVVACLYWFFIYFMHSRAIYSSGNPFIYLHLPNFVVLFVGLILLFRLRKN